MKDIAGFSLNIGGKLIEFDRPAVMGIINVTPDSFYAGSRITPAANFPPPPPGYSVPGQGFAARPWYSFTPPPGYSDPVQGSPQMPADTIDRVVRRAVEMADAGADIIDIGGCSTRPGFRAPSIEEEIERVVPAIRAVRRVLPTMLISVDTYRREVAREAVAAGADIVNDIAGIPSLADPDTVAAAGCNRSECLTVDDVAALHVPYVLTHNESLEGVADADVATEVIVALQRRLSALTLAGVADVIIDPGFGFSKTIEQNYALLASLKTMALLGAPILAGVSRKSMIFKALNISPDDCATPSQTLSFAALERGAAIIRTHDPALTRQTIKLYSLLSNF